jgi:hypothetical protein
MNSLKAFKLSFLKSTHKSAFNNFEQIKRKKYFCKARLP